MISVYNLVSSRSRMGPALLRCLRKQRVTSPRPQEGLPGTGAQDALQSWACSAPSSFAGKAEEPAGP